MSSDPYHKGERAVQEAAGEQEAAEQNGVIIADALAGRAVPFLQAQRMLVVASRDNVGRLWASLVFGQTGFTSVSDNGHSVTIDRTRTYASSADILWSNVRPAAPVGLLAIDFSIRRRLRVNGQIDRLSDEQLVLHVEQAYNNCPKYIQRRQLRDATSRMTSELPAATEGQLPNAAILAAVNTADTAFIASGHPTRGLDASHRGGPPGFIQILAPNRFRIPDYMGNGMFNTLGNLYVDARCGLTVLDFAQGQLHQMTGTASLHVNSHRAGDDSPLTGRSWDFLIEGWRSSGIPLQAKWEFIDYSPYNPP